MASPPTDLELMMLADGELGAARAREVAAFVERDPVARAKLESLARVGESVKTYLELETDQAERDVPEFADLWSHVERGIRAAAPAERDAAPTRPPVVDPALAWWERTRAFFVGFRGHMVTGLVSAGAALALVIWLRPERIVHVPVGVGGPGNSAIVATPASAPPCAPRVLPAAPPEVEDFEVYGGSGMVFTLPSEGEGDSSAAVIWINKDQDRVEGPI